MKSEALLGDNAATMQGTVWRRSDTAWRRSDPAWRGRVRRTAKRPGWDPADVGSRHGDPSRADVATVRAAQPRRAHRDRGWCPGLHRAELAGHRPARGVAVRATGPVIPAGPRRAGVRGCRAVRRPAALLGPGTRGLP